MCPAYIFVCIYVFALCTFCLDAKSTKKIKANPKAPPVLPCQRTAAVIINWSFLLRVVRLCTTIQGRIYFVGSFSEGILRKPLLCVVPSPSERAGVRSKTDIKQKIASD